MEILDYITIAVFAAGIMFVGSLFSSTGKNMKSFFAGGGNVPWWISGLSLFMGFFSAGTFVVWGSIAYSMGFVAVTIQLTMAAAGFAVGLLIAPRWNKTGCLTAAEYITRRYGASTQKLYTYIFLFISIFYNRANEMCTFYKRNVQKKDFFSRQTKSVQSVFEQRLNSRLETQNQTLFS